MSYPLPETKDYTVEIGTTTTPNDDNVVYKIINKHTSVVEFESTVLPNVYHSIKELQRLLSEAEKEETVNEAQVMEMGPRKLDS